MQDFKKLKVWEKAYQLALEVYRVTGSFPDSERFGLTAQLRRAVISITSNIAEGCGRDKANDFARFLDIAMGSASEIENQLMLARDLGFMKPELYPAFEHDVIEVKRMLASLIRQVRNG